MFHETIAQGLSANAILLGVIVGITSTSIQSLGLTLQRKSHLLEDECSNNGRTRPIYRRRMWQLGFVLFVLSNLVGSSVQITTLPLLVLSALQVAGLIFNALCASLLLDEPLTRYSLLGTLLASAGAILIAVFGALPESAHNLSQLLELFIQPGFMLWIVAQCLCDALLAIVAFVLLNSGRSVGPHLFTICGILYGIISGSLSAHALLLAKTAFELVVRTIIDHDNQFRFWQSWLILALLLALSLIQLYFLNRGLKFISTSVLYPMVFCIYSITAILDALIYYRQYQKLTPRAVLLVVLGTVIMLIGVVFLSWRFQVRQFASVEEQSVQCIDAASSLVARESEMLLGHGNGAGATSCSHGSLLHPSQGSRVLAGKHARTVTFQSPPILSAGDYSGADSFSDLQDHSIHDQNKATSLMVQLWEDLEEG